MVDYLYQQKRMVKTLDAAELETGFSFAHDEIISVHSQVPTLEDVFIRYTGRGLDG